jgi:hypothetical protein
MEPKVPGEMDAGVIVTVLQEADTRLFSRTSSKTHPAPATFVPLSCPPHPVLGYHLLEVLLPLCLQPPVNLPWLFTEYQT